jgi:hypothetical protein
MAIYTKDKYDRLKYKFKDSEKIDENQSQAYQDMFVLSMLNGKKNGTYLEIGASHAKMISNTYLLEKLFDWNGISIDISIESKHSFDEYNRKNTLIIEDALTLDYREILSKTKTKQIDYLQLDIEPQYNTLNCLKLIPFDEYRFSVITYETDLYDPSINRIQSLRNRDESREIILSHGYELVGGNICNTSKNDFFEDWYIDPKIVNKDILNLYEKSTEFNDIAENFLLNY